MGRPRIDKAHEKALESIVQAAKMPGFGDSLDRFEGDWKRREYQDVFFNRSSPGWDEVSHQKTYSGLYYDLREICDRYGIDWPNGGELIMRVLKAKVTGMSDDLQPDDCPPQEYWEWFRMARQGLGLPRENEMLAVPQLTPTLRKRPLQKGLTSEDIEELYDTTERTVRTAINKCWQYLDRDNINLEKIAKLAGLEGMEILYLITRRMEKLKGKKPEK